MPLIILGLIFLIGILIVQIVKFIQENKESGTTVRDRYKDKFKKDEEPEKEQEKTLFFPTDNVETEKHKRNIR